MNQASFKDFEMVSLKATYNMKIGDKTFLPGETVAYFDKIQIAGLQDQVARVNAHGGFNDAPRVFWETTNDQTLTFSQGVFSVEQFAIYNNCRVLTFESEDAIPVGYRERLESDENGVITCKYAPAYNLFIYNAATGDTIAYTGVDGNQVTIGSSFTEVIVDYSFRYENNGKVLLLGRKWFEGFLELEGITRVKDDTTGQVVTGVLKIPRLKLMSDLSIRLGAQANPVVANFSAIAIPVGPRGSSYISEFYYLNDDIQSDL